MLFTYVGGRWTMAFVACVIDALTVRMWIACKADEGGLKRGAGIRRKMLGIFCGRSRRFGQIITWEGAMYVKELISGSASVDTRGVTTYLLLSGLCVGVRCCYGGLLRWIPSDARTFNCW